MSGNVNDFRQSISDALLGAARELALDPSVSSGEAQTRLADLSDIFAIQKSWSSRMRPGYFQYPDQKRLEHFMRICQELYGPKEASNG